MVRDLWLCWSWCWGCVNLVWVDLLFEVVFVICSLLDLIIEGLGNLFEVWMIL